MWDVEDIRARLAAMRAEDRELQRFGARRHRYRFGPTLREADLAAFEGHHHITLPDTYRSFLREVGDGGAGPYCGLFPLDGEGLSDQDREERLRPGYLATPFPHTQAWNPAYHVPEPGVPGPGDMMTEDEYFDERWTAGSLVIAEFGCGAFHRLIITGPTRGQVWFDDRAADGGLTPEADFPDWYQDWLHNRR
ncbi:SMI1/KNR4 family protein [Micromonospora sp. NPDC005710]|uniref:SMI1/KNR4 family protein n=2 Tax=Micromonospora TaxID=1873 RepID=UPI0033EEDFE5